MSIFNGEKWGTPHEVTNRLRTGADQHRYIKKLGNLVVFRHPSGEYWLVYVSASLGGWSTSALNLVRSADGVSWGPAMRLVSGPFLNLSTLVKGAALFRNDGLVALPAYHELFTSYAKLLFLDSAGNVVHRARIGDACQIQPWLVTLGGSRALALMRQKRCLLKRLWSSSTEDGGVAWSEPEATELDNPDSPAAALVLPDGRIVAVLNDHTKDANVLSLVVSNDEGATWRDLGPVFDGTADKLEYRYPWLLQDKEGRIHVFASEAKRGIRHAILGADVLTATP
jgi:predicted neuraminidase